MALDASERIKASVLSLSAAALVAIALSEGYRDTTYIPIDGDKYTIGFGSTEGVKLGDTTTPPKALARALRDVQQFEGALKKCVTVPLAQHEYDAFVMLAYNIGSRNFCESTLVRKLNSGDYEGACREILRWNRAGGRVVEGLTARRKREYQRCTGDSE